MILLFEIKYKICLSNLFYRGKFIIGGWILKQLHYLSMTKHQNITKKYLCLKYLPLKVL